MHQVLTEQPCRNSVRRNNASKPIWSAPHIKVAIATACCPNHIFKTSVLLYRTPELRLLDSRQWPAGGKRVDMEHYWRGKWKWKVTKRPGDVTQLEHRRAEQQQRRRELPAARLVRWLAVEWRVMSQTTRLLYLWNWHVISHWIIVKRQRHVTSDFCRFSSYLYICFSY